MEGRIHPWPTLPVRGDGTAPSRGGCKGIVLRLCGQKHTVFFLGTFCQVFPQEATGPHHS